MDRTQGRGAIMEYNGKSTYPQYFVFGEPQAITKKKKKTESVFS